MNRAFLILAVIGLLLFLLLAEPPARPVEDAQGRPSTFFTDRTGARALFLAQQKLHGRLGAEQLRAPLDSLETVEQTPDTLVLAGPERPLGELEEPALDAWLEGGGQLILASSTGWEREGGGKTYLGSYGLNLQPVMLDDRSVTAEPGGLHLWLRSACKLEGDGESRVLERSGNRILAVEVPIDKGRIVVLSDPWAVSNEALRQGDNGLWLLRLIADWGDGRAMFDEYHHGFGEPASLLQMMARYAVSPWGWPLLELSLLGLAYLVLGRRRLGRPVRPVPRRLTDPMLLLQARAGLLRGAEAGPLALDQILGQLAYSLREPTGRPADLAELQARLAREGREAEAARLEELLTVSEQARRTGKLSPSRLLEAATQASRLGEELTRGSQADPGT